MGGLFILNMQLVNHFWGYAIYKIVEEYIKIQDLKENPILF